MSVTRCADATEGASAKAAALAAMFTAVVRPSLPYAPAFHVRAPVFGSGKTYLCELIGVHHPDCIKLKKEALEKSLAVALETK